MFLFKYLRISWGWYIQWFIHKLWFNTLDTEVAKIKFRYLKELFHIYKIISREMIEHFGRLFFFSPLKVERLTSWRKKGSRMKGPQSGWLRGQGCVTWEPDLLHSECDWVREFLKVQWKLCYFTEFRILRTGPKTFQEGKFLNLIFVSLIRLN